jgi:hypothetical protein
MKLTSLIFYSGIYGLNLFKKKKNMKQIRKEVEQKFLNHSMNQRETRKKEEYLVKCAILNLLLFINLDTQFTYSLLQKHTINTEKRAFIQLV